MEKRDPPGPAALDPRAALQALSKDELVEIVLDDAKNWLAHDGLWFQAVERAHGMEAAIAADGEAWERFTVLEAERIMSRLGMAPGGGIPALLRCLGQRFYSRLNVQEAIEVSDRRAVFVMRNCRVQSARRRKGLPDFPCKPVGLIEYAGFARAIDPRLATRCVTCPPDAPREDLHCAWEFTLEEGEAAGATGGAP